MVSFTSLSLLLQCFLCVSMAKNLALDGPQTSKNNYLSARNTILALRQNVVYCGETDYTSYCVDNVCCGTINCMLADAVCCSNGQYCLSGTTCQWDGAEMSCQCDTDGCTNAGTATAESAATSAGSTPSPSTSPSSSATSKRAGYNSWLRLASLLGVAFTVELGMHLV